MHLFNRTLLCIIVLSISIVGQANFSLIKNEFIWKNTRGDDYSPFDKRGYYSKVTLEINLPSNVSGQYFLSFTNNNNTNYRIMNHEQSSDRLNYYISKSQNTNQYLTSWPNISNDEGTVLINLDNSTGPILRVPLYIWIDPGQTVMPGNYSEVIPIMIYKGSYNSDTMPVELKSMNLTCRVVVSNEAQISIGSDSFSNITDFKVKFESLIEGEIITYKAYVKSTKDYTLQVYSENKSRLKNENDKIKTIIPYKIFIDNVLVQFLDDSLQEIEVSKSNSDEMTEHQIKLILGNAGHAFKGSYYDKVSLRAKTE